MPEHAPQVESAKASRVASMRAVSGPKPSAEGGTWLNAFSISPVVQAAARIRESINRSPRVVAQRKQIEGLLGEAREQPVQRIEGGELEELTSTDWLENWKLERSAGLGTATNEFGEDIPGTTTAASSRKFNLTNAKNLQIDVSSVLKDLNQKHGNKPRSERADIFDGLLTEEIRKVVTAYDKAVKTMTTLGIPATEQENLYADLLNLGHRPSEIADALGQIDSRFRKEFKLKNNPLAFLKNYFKEKKGPSAVTIDPTAFKPQTYTTTGPEDLVKESAERSRSGGTTIGSNPYIARHFTDTVMDFLVKNAGVEIHIFEGAVSGALGVLAASGYTEVRALSDNDFTDFRKFTARKAETGDTVFAVVGPSGRAYQREIAAHFLYHDPPIAPGRIFHFTRGENAAKDEFAMELRQLDVDPDVILMGNVAEVKSKLSERNVKPVREIVSPNLYGVLYSVNNYAMLSLKVEPHLYADRAGAFLKAVQSRSTKQRHVIFTGTAGGFEDFMEINDLVAPETFSQSDTLENSPSDTTNLAAKLFTENYTGKTGMFSKDMSHGAVDTILFEDNTWLKAHRNKDKEHLSIVEQELGGLAKAVDKTYTTLSAFFRISDLPGRQDFSENEVNRPPPRTPVSQGDLVIEMLESLLKTKDLKDTGAPAVKGKSTVTTREKALVFQTAEKVYTLATNAYEIIGQIDPKLARNLDQAVRDLIAQFQNNTLNATQFATRLTKLHEVYRLVPDLTSRHQPTTFNLQLETLGPINLEISDSSKRITMHRLNGPRNRDRWSLAIDILPKGDRFDYKVYDKTAKVKEGTGTGGQSVSL